MSLERYLPRSLRSRFTLLVLACTAAIFLCTAPLAVWQGQQLLFERQIHDVQDRLDATISKGDAEMREIRQQAIAMTDLIEQWEAKNLDAWFEYMEFALRRLPKAFGVRLAFEPGTDLGPQGVRSLYVRRGAGNKPERVQIDYRIEDPASHGSKWYAPVRDKPTDSVDGIWSEPFSPPETHPETVISCSAPIMAAQGHKTTFGGVAGMDVTVGTVIETLRKLDLANEFQIFVLNPSKQVTIAAQGGKRSAATDQKLREMVQSNPDAFRPFSELQDSLNPTGWFVAKSPYDGLQSCFLFQRLSHNASQLLYVVPVRALRGDIFWLLGGVGIIGVASMAGMGFLIRWSAGLVTSNLDILREGVKNVRAGKLRKMLPAAKSHDETADIVDAFNGMVGELQNAFCRAEDLARQQQRVATELDLARSIQQSALPDPIQLPGGQIFSCTLPAQEVGGDFYDTFNLPCGRVALALGDVSGKGVSAALFMVRASLLLRSAASAMDPKDAIAQVNSMLVKSNTEMMFVTLFFAVWDPLAEKLTCVNAGHNPPVILRADGSFERLDRRSGPAIGAMSGQAFPAWETPFRDGDLLAVYTDGITEAPDSTGKQFGESRLRELLPLHLKSNLDAVAKNVVERVTGWQGGGERFDDITLLLAKATPPPCMLELPASPDTIEKVVEAIESCSRDGGMKDPAASEIALAACEAATNVITHSLKSDPSRKYRIYIGWAGDELLVRLEDDGPPFDPDSLATVDLSAPLEDRPIGGLGWVLIRKVTDCVHMDRVSDTNILTLTRHRDRPTIGQKKANL